MKRYFRQDFKRIGHATKVARYAEQIAKEERGEMVVVICSAYLSRYRHSRGGTEVWQYRSEVSGRRRSGHCPGDSGQTFGRQGYH
jgi:hypothetical protein